MQCEASLRGASLRHACAGNEHEYAFAREGAWAVCCAGHELHQ